MRSTRLLPALAASLLAASPATAQFTIGDALADRDVIDAFFDFILVSPYTFSAAAFGEEVTTVTVRGGNTPAFGSNVGRTFVPLLVTDPSGGSFTITAIGTARTVPGLGDHTFDFGLTAGSAVVGPATRVAWVTKGAGAIMFDHDADGQLYAHTAFMSAPTVSLGQSFAVESALDRAYSVQFTAGAAPSTVPEPATSGLVTAGAIALAALARRRRRA